MSKSSINIALLFFIFPLVNFAYWQQEANYSIDVTLNDKTHELIGFIDIEYTNNSPDTLTYLFIHLWPNAYKNDNTPLAKQLLLNNETNFHYSKNNDKGFIEDVSFKINNKQVVWALYKNSVDIAKIDLEIPLLPKQKINISTPFRVKIPLGDFSRLGHIDQSYQITQWYPKPAVYDAEGWHPINYLDQGEFYSEYGSFNVKITLPENYIVGATGDLQGESAQKEEEWLLYKAKQTEEKISKAKKEGFGEIFNKTNDSTFTPSSPRTKTLHYYQQNVHDFAWFANKDWNVLKGEVELPHSKRKVNTWAMFTDAEAPLWQKSLTYIHDATYYYSLWNGEYPYNHVTAVDGALSAGSGMEYPNITIIGETSNALMLEQVIMHEVGHNWFYGILGNNERRYAWMDEGINSFNELRYMQQKFPNYHLSDLFFAKAHKYLRENDPHHLQNYYLMYLLKAKKAEDQSLNLSSEEYSGDNYGQIVYSKSAAIFYYLYSYLGEQQFDYCMKMYFNQWKFKHPKPRDLENIFNQNTSLNLSWFFNDLIETEKVLDYQIIRQFSTQDSIAVVVENEGGINGPVVLTCLVADSIVNEFWFEGFSGKKQLLIPNQSYSSIVIDGKQVMPEINRSNNRLNINSFFPRMEPIKIKFLTSIENPSINNLYYLPTIGFNEHDKLMLGMAFHNYQIPLKNLQFWVNPMYSFHTNIINGNAHFNYFIRKPFYFVNGIELMLNTQQYSIDEYLNYTARFQKTDPSLLIHFKNKTATSPYKTTWKTRVININKEMIAGFGVDKYDVLNNYKTYFESALNISKNSTLHSFNINLAWQGGDDFSKITLQGLIKIKTNKKGKELRLRFFQGSFIDRTSIINQQFTLRGHREEDYLYDQVMLGRNLYNKAHVLAQQIAIADGGFKTGLYSKDIRGNWLSALNFSYDLPIRFITLFADLGTSDGVIENGTSSFYYDAGVQLTLIPETIEIYFPLFMSKELSRDYTEREYNYLQKIRFMINFNKINPLKSIKKI